MSPAPLSMIKPLTAGQIAVCALLPTSRQSINSLLSILFNRTDIEISLDHHGKPQSAIGHFSLSHTRQRLVLAASLDQPLGIDIEDRSALSMAVQQRCLNRSEQTAHAADSISLWCIKEAIVKALGRGIAFGLTRIEVRALHEQQAEIAIDQAPAPNWQIHRNILGLKTNDALAYQSPVRRVLVGYC
jgi:4'-phosphopantetheinyl transferase